MFAPRRGKVSINPGGSPEFQAQYIGSTETFVANGTGCTIPLVQKLWDNCPEERFLKRVLLIISPAGIHMKFLDAGRKSKDKDVVIDIQDISYCCAQHDIHDRVFAWICKGNNSNGPAKCLECHAVLCSSKEKAQTISLVLSRAFHIAYREWKLEKDKKGRSTSKQTLSQESATPSSSRDVAGNTAEKTIKTNNEASVESNATKENIHGFNEADSGGAINKLPMRFVKTYPSGVPVSNGGFANMSENQTKHAENFKNGTAKTIKPKQINEDALELNTYVGKMNIVEEDEVSFTDNNITFESDGEQEIYTEHL